MFKNVAERSRMQLVKIVSKFGVDGGAAVRKLRKRHAVNLANSRHETDTLIFKFFQIGSESDAFQLCIIYIQ